MSRKLPPLTAIKAFEAAARHESYVKASKELSVTPTAISQQVAHLEAYLEVKLFVRMANTLKLTSAGRVFLPDLSNVLDSLANAATKVRKERISGTVKLGVLPAMAVHWLIPNLKSFKSQFPDLNLSIHTSPNLEISSEDLDLNIRYFDGKSSNHYCRFLMDEYVFPICSPKLLNKVSLNSLSDLKQFSLIHDIDGRRTQPWLGWQLWLGDRDIQQHPGFEFRDSISVMHAAINGLGVALGRSALIGDLLSTGQLVAPLKNRKPADFSYYIEVRKDLINEPEIRAVIEWLLELSAFSK